MTKSVFNDDDPMLIAHNGTLCWQFPNGRIFPVVRGGADEPDEKKFTQADMDRVVADRLARAKSDPPADYAQLQAAAAELATLKAKDNTDLDNAKAEIAKITGERDAAKAETDTAKNEAKEIKLRMAVVAEAAKAKAVNPDQVFALLPKDAVTIGDDGQVTGAEKAVTDFITANPHFVGSPSRPKPDPAQGAKGDAKDFGSAGLAEARKRFGTPAAAGAQQQQ